jgi:Zn-dependent protease with chaperone function
LIPSYWYSTLGLYLWQVSIHSLIVALITVVWLKRRGLPNGVARRQLLSMILVLPLVTAAIPRGGLEFRHTSAWFDSHRLLLLPLGSRWQVYHLALGLVALVVILTFWQELVPVLRRRRATDGTLPARELVDFARSLPGWERCEVDVYPSDDVLIATGGWPPRPRLHLSTGALGELDAEEIRAVVRHEAAHWLRWRWISTHLLFLARLAQIYNPVALWAFREYTVELEIACDRSATRGQDREPLAKALFKIYRGSHPAELSERATLRRRVDVLIGRREFSGDRLPPQVLVAIALILMVTIPWIA